ncbi:MAG: ABC transporter permease [Immundisolibacterales bacterium]|nr:ABC transporter permease [Immundisolibacterales bacterium]
MDETRGPSLLDAIRDFSENASPLDFVLIAQHWEMFLTGIGYTVLLVAVSLVIGGAISLPLAVARAYRIRYVNQAIWAYVYLFRGTPLLVQLYIIYYGLGQFEPVRESFLWPVLREPLWCTLIAFVLNTAAYTTEIFRGAIEAVPHGEVEAARAYGMSSWHRTTRIVLPNALRRALPAYSNEIIFMLHGSVVASTVTIVDILGAGRILNSKYYLAYEGFLAAAVLYMLLVYLVTRGFRLWEWRWHAHLRPREA